MSSEDSIYPTAIFMLAVIIAIISLIFFRLRLRYQRLEKAATLKKIELQTIKELIFISSKSLGDIETSLNQMLALMLKNLGWRAHSVFILQERDQILTLKTAVGLSDWYMEVLKNEVKIKVGDASIGRAVATREPAVLNNAFEDPRMTSLLPFAIEGKYKGLLALPLIGKVGKIYGSFVTYSPEANQFGTEEVEFFEIIGVLLTEAIEKSIRIRRLQEKPSDKLLNYKEIW